MANPPEPDGTGWRPRKRAGKRAELDHGLARAIGEAIAANDAQRVAELADTLHVADKADLLEQVTHEERSFLVGLWGEALDPEILPYLDEPVRDEIVGLLPHDRLVRAIGALDADDAIYVIEALEEGERQELLDALPPPDRAALQEGLTYEEESAGRLMQRQVVTAPAYWSVGHVIDYLRAAADSLPEEFYDVFVVDPQRRPVGTVPLARLVRTQRPVIVRDIMRPEPHLARVDMDQEEVAYLFSQYGLTSVAVVDGDGRIVGAITHDDVTEVIEQEAEEDILHLGGVGETDLHDSVAGTTRGRVPWLFVNLLTAVVASAVIALFEDSINRLVALAVLMPIVASMGGNAGTQTMTVAVRGLATRDLTPSNAARLLGKEILVGGMNGLLFAVIMGAVVWAWYGDAVLGLAIGLAMIIALIAAGLAGTLIPLALAKLKVDPAVSAGVFLTTVTDVVGFFTFLGLATLLLL
ncbi:MAG: magnesium transporter [Alphaproteobacteria bacterium]